MESENVKFEEIEKTENEVKTENEEKTENEVKFENEVTITNNIYKEWYEAQFREMRKKIGPLISISIVMLLVVSGSDLLDDGFNWGSVFLILCAGICLVLYLKGASFLVNRFYKKYVKLNGTEMLIKFNDEQTEISAGKSSVQVHYSMITKIMETPNLYLMFIQNGAYIAGKNGFTLGNAEDFPAFIKGKCPKAKYSA